MEIVGMRGNNFGLIPRHGALDVCGGAVISKKVLLLNNIERDGPY